MDLNRFSLRGWAGFAASAAACGVFAAALRAEEPEPVRPVPIEPVRPPVTAPREAPKELPQEETPGETARDPAATKPETVRPSAEPGTGTSTSIAPGWQMPREEGLPEGDPPPKPAGDDGESAPPAPVSADLEAAIGAEKAARELAAKKKKPVDWTALAQNYRAVTEARPDDAAAHYRLGLACARGGNVKDALLSLQKAVLLRPRDAQYLIDYATVNLQAGRLEEAEGASAKAIQLEPANARAYNALGNVYLAAGSSPEAVKCYVQAIRCDPSNIQYVHNAGRAYYDAGDYKSAVEAFTKVVEERPKSPAAYNDRGLAHLALKQIRQAQENFHTALHMDSKFAPAHYNLALLYADDQMPEFSGRMQAQDHAEEAVRLTERKNAQYLLGLAEAHRANRRYDLAVKVALEAVKLEDTAANRAQLQRFEQLEKQGFEGVVRSISGREP